jgi:hypothetical protein
MMQSTSILFADTPKLFDDGLFPFVHPFDPIAQRRFHRSDIANHPVKTLRLYGGRLIASPHGSIQRDMPLHDASA